MRRRLILACLLAAASLPAEVLDRIAVSVGRRAYTESDLLLEIRLSSFLNQTEPDFSPENRKAAARRLVERALIEAEMEAGNYQEPKGAEVEPALESLKKSRPAVAAQFEQALQRYGIREEELRRYLLEQLSLLRFIDARFGAAVQVSDTDLREYFVQKFLPEWQNKSKEPAPAFDDVRGDLDRMLRQQRADVLLDDWLREAGGRTRVEYKDEALR